MLAAVLPRHGGPEVLQVREVPDPAPGPEDLLVAVVTAGVQPFDTLVRSGVMAAAAGRLPSGIGTEYAGVVVARGEGALWPPVGTEVIGWATMAAHAELVVAPPGTFVVRPATVPWPQAGALGASGQTALSALDDLAVEAGETLLVTAAAGGAGSMTVQLALRRGARVVGTAGAAQHDLLRGLGVVPVEYGPGWVERVRRAAPQGIDAALDAVGGSTLGETLQLVSDLARVGTLVDHAAADRLGVLGIRARRSREQLQHLADLAADGRLRVTVRACYPLEEMARAHADVGTGHGGGKVVLSVAPPPSPGCTPREGER